jgi:hypothetical protein
MPKVDCTRRTGLAVALSLVLAGSLVAQAAAQKPAATPAAAPAPAATPAQTPAQTPAPVPAQNTGNPNCTSATARVTDVYNEVPGNKTAQLRDTITIQVTGLDSLLAEAKCRGDASGAGKPEDIVLYLDDRPVPDLVAFPPTDPQHGILKFPLRRSEDSRDVWTYVLGKPGFKPRKMKVSIGLKHQYAIPVRENMDSLSLDVIPTRWFRFWLLLFVVFVIGFFYLARRTDLLRDPAPLPGGDARRPYSLARTQASWWFFLILAGYLFIGMITGDFSSSITSTCLILMGISAGTAVGSAFIDASKDTPETARLQAATKQKLSNDVQRLSSDIPTVESVVKQNPNDPTAEEILAAKQLELANKLSQLHKAKNESQFFLQDILSDANGVNFHRFQMLAWTIVLGIIFVGNVYRDLAMPDFNSTLLSLMGISAGTYLGLKIPEDTVPKTDPALTT